MGFIIANDYATTMNVETALLLVVKLVNLGMYLSQRGKMEVKYSKNNFFKAYPIPILVLVLVTLPLCVLKLNLANPSSH